MKTVSGEQLLSLLAALVVGGCIGFGVGHAVGTPSSLRGTPTPTPSSVVAPSATAGPSAPPTSSGTAAVTSAQAAAAAQSAFTYKPPSGPSELTVTGAPVYHAPFLATTSKLTSYLGSTQSLPAKLWVVTISASKIQINSTASGPPPAPVTSVSYFIDTVGTPNIVGAFLGTLPSNLS